MTFQIIISSVAILHNTIVPFDIFLDFTSKNSLELAPMKTKHMSSNLAIGAMVSRKLQYKNKLQQT